MSTVIDVHTPDGQQHRHVTSAQNGEVEVRELSDGGVEVVGVHATPEIRSGSVSRPATRREEVLGTYPAGSRIAYAPAESHRAFGSCLPDTVKLQRG